MQTLNQFHEEKEQSSILLWMSFINLTDFLLLTPSLVEAQKSNPHLVITVPDVLWDLYDEAEVFAKAVPASRAHLFLRTQERGISVLNLTATALGHFPQSGTFAKANSLFASIQSAETYQRALRANFPELSPNIEFKSFLDLNADLDVLRSFGVKPFYYFTLYSGTNIQNCSLKNLEITVELILEKYPEITCLNIVGPDDRELFENSDAPKNFSNVRAGLLEIAHLLAASLFHLDNGSGVFHLANAMDVPAIEVASSKLPSWMALPSSEIFQGCPHGCPEDQCQHKAFLNSLRPTLLAENAAKILSAYIHI